MHTDDDTSGEKGRSVPTPDPLATPPSDRSVERLLAVLFPRLYPQPVAPPGAAGDEPEP